MTKIQIDAAIYADVKAGIMTKTAIAKKYGTSTRSVGRAVERHEKRMADKSLQQTVSLAVIKKPIVREPTIKNSEIQDGDTVLLSPESQWVGFAGDANPMGVEGEVQFIEGVNDSFKVLWSNGRTNVYFTVDSDFTLVKRAFEEQEVEQQKTIYFDKTSNSELVVGDVVMLSEHSNWPVEESNPRGVKGVIDEHEEGSPWIHVQWSNKSHNAYRSGDNDLILLERDGKIVKPTSEKPANDIPALQADDEVEIEVAESSLMDALKSGDRVEYVLTGDSVILTMNNETEIVDSTHPNYKAIREAIFNEDFKAAFELMNIRKAIETFTQGNIRIEGEKLFYGEMQVKTELADKIIQLMQKGDDGFQRLIKFFELLMQNPSRSSVEQLWGFVCHNDVEIDEDGYLIGWKKVQSKGNNLFDSRTGKVPNNVGCVVEMPRWMVDDRRSVTCSQGLHVGAWDYVRSFSGNVITKVRMSPADVVSVPDDYDDMKVRTSKYEVVGLVNSSRQDIPNTYEYKRQHVMVGSAGEILGIKDIQ